MPGLSEHPVSCPYCGEHITVLVDESLAEQSYVEDCQVCCRPIVLEVAVLGDGQVTVSAMPENG